MPNKEVKLFHEVYEKKPNTRMGNANYLQVQHKLQEIDPMRCLLLETGHVQQTDELVKLTKIICYSFSS